MHGAAVELSAVNAPTGSDSGVAQGARLLAFTDAVMGADDGALARERSALRAVLSGGAFVDTCAVGEGLAREGGDWAAPRVRAYAERMGSAQVLALGRDANRHPPELTAFDRFGHRIDEVAFHASWHALMAISIEHAVHALPWREP